MKIYKFCSSLFLSIFVFASLNAQNTNKGTDKLPKDSLLNEITNIDKRVKVFIHKDPSTGYSAPLQMNQSSGVRLDNSGLIRNANGLLVVPNFWVPFDEYTSFQDTIIFEPAFLPVVFDGKILPSNLNFLSKAAPKGIAPDFHLIPSDSTFAPQLARVERVQGMRRYYYQNNFEKIKLNALLFKNNPVITEKKIQKKNAFEQFLSTDDAISVAAPELEKFEIEKVHWIKKGEHSLQINQNSLSDNWFTGGNKNLNVLNYHRLDAKYKKNKITLDNIIEWKLNFQNTQGDTLRNINVMEDFFRIYSVFGVNAYKRWSYTANTLITTPLFNSYPINSKEKRAAIFSPLMVNVGIGMRYALEKVSTKDKARKLNWTVDLAPISVNYTFVGDKGVNETRFGIKEGHMSNTDFGMTAIMNVTYSFNRFASVTSRFKYFTDYQKVLMESESRFNFIISQYFSTSVYAYVRYDDGVPALAGDDSMWRYFQWNQILSFGLNYRWGK